jgi:hypothetical protein
MASFQGIRLRGFFRGREATQFEEEMAGGSVRRPRKSIADIVREALEEARRALIRAGRSDREDWVAVKAAKALLKDELGRATTGRAATWSRARPWPRR